MCNTQVWVCVTGHTYILHRCSHVCECAWRRGENAVTAHAVIVLERRGRTRPALSEGTLSLVLYASLVTSAISLYIAAHQRLCCHYQRLTWLLEWFIIRQGCRDTSGIIKMIVLLFSLDIQIYIRPECNWVIKRSFSFSLSIQVKCSFIYINVSSY